MLKTTPAVFAVGRDYQILALTQTNAFFSVRVGDREFFDATSGVSNSRKEIHRVTIPQAILDAAGEYTVCIRPIVRRKPYFTRTREPEEVSFPFRPVPAERIRAFHIADAHNRITEPLAAAVAFGKMDLLILNGDIIDFCSHTDKFYNIYELCAALTGGEIPVVFSRGNHDMRGRLAETFIDYIPNRHGNTYYTFRLGSIWGMILDHGEDKPDEHIAYGGTIACHDFRLRQIDFLKEVIANAATEYDAPDVKTKVILSHVPFTEKNVPPFDIEKDIFRQWTGLVAQIQPHVMICGHTHLAEVREPGHVRDTYGQCCPVVIASGFEGDRWIGSGFEFSTDQIHVTYTDSDGQIRNKHTIQK